MPVKREHLTAIRQWARAFGWAEYLDFCLAARGSRERVKGIEDALPELVQRGELVVVEVGNRHFYHTRGVGLAQTPHIYHDNLCTKALLHFWHADRSGAMVEAKRFHGFGIRPDGGIRYDTRKKMVVWEVQTKTKVRYTPYKLRLYERHLGKLETHFDAQILVVVILETDALPRWVEGKPYFFVSKEEFFSVPLGGQLTSPIYTWGMDMQQYALRPQT